jgi:hypothetical protein
VTHKDKFALINIAFWSLIATRNQLYKKKNHLSWKVFEIKINFISTDYTIEQTEVKCSEGCE